MNEVDWHQLLKSLAVSNYSNLYHAAHQLNGDASLLDAQVLVQICTAMETVAELNSIPKL